MRRHYFQWSEGNYGAVCSNKFVLLCAVADDYSALEEEASLYLILILKSSLTKVGDRYHFEEKTNREYDEEKLNHYIRYFTDSNLIEVTFCSKRQNHVAYPHCEGGIKEMEWVSRNKSDSSELWLTIKALFHLRKINVAVNKGGMSGLINFLDALSHKTRNKTISVVKSLILASSLEKACLLYPKKTKCLIFAATLFSLHCEQKLNCDFAIGVQNLPFYAHAWIEVDGAVINDNPELQKKLAVIFKISQKNSGYL